jgi:hypothetical protein
VTGHVVVRTDDKRPAPPDLSPAIERLFALAAELMPFKGTVTGVLILGEGPEIVPGKGPSQAVRLVSDVDHRGDNFRRLAVFVKDHANEVRRNPRGAGG